MIAEIKALVVVTDRFGENITLKTPVVRGKAAHVSCPELNLRVREYDVKLM
jgi:C4-type Zn-finger protein